MIGKETQTENSRLLYESSHGSSRREEKCGTCPICYDPIQNGKVELGCNHTFCVDCFTKFYLKDNNKNEDKISTEKSDSITKRELANDKLNEREMIKQVCDNPFLMNNNYIDVISTQQEFLTPQNSNY